MFDWIGSIANKMAIGISSLLIAVAGVISPAPLPSPEVSTAPTSTSQTATTGIASSAASTSFPTTKNTSVPVVEKKTTPQVNSVLPKTDPIVTQPQQPTAVQPLQGIQCNGKVWNSCPTGQSFVCPGTGSAYCSIPPASNSTSNTNVHTGTNYYDQYKARVKAVLAIDKAFQTWLQDTSNQFRSASLTLAGYNLGGLYGQSRDAAIKLANAEISVISSTQSNNAQWIARYENIVDVLNSDPNGFVEASLYNQLPTPETEQADIDSVKKSVNSSLDMVLNALQYH